MYSICTYSNATQVCSEYYSGRFTTLILNNLCFVFSLLHTGNFPNIRNKCTLFVTHAALFSYSKAEYPTPMHVNSVYDGMRCDQLSEWLIYRDVCHYYPFLKIHIYMYIRKNVNIFSHTQVMDVKIWKINNGQKTKAVYNQIINTSKTFLSQSMY